MRSMIYSRYLFVVLSVFPAAGGSTLRGHGNEDVAHSVEDKVSLLRGTKATPQSLPLVTSKQRRTAEAEAESKQLIHGSAIVAPKLIMTGKTSRKLDTAGSTFGNTFGNTFADPVPVDTTTITQETEEAAEGPANAEWENYADFSSWTLPQEDREVDVEEEEGDQNIIVPDDGHISRPLDIGEEVQAGFQQETPEGSVQAEPESEIEATEEAEKEESSKGVLGAVSGFVKDKVVTEAASGIGDVLCSVTGLCVGPLPTPPPTMAPTVSAAPSMSPTGEPTTDFNNAGFIYQSYFWFFGSVLDAAPIFNTKSRFVFCRVLGECFDPPPDVAETLPDWDDPMWAQRLCDVAHICFPTISPTSAPTISAAPSAPPSITTPYPTIDKQPASEPVMPLAAPTPQQGDIESAETPQPVSIFGKREPGTPLRCRFSTSC